MDRGFKQYHRREICFTNLGPAYGCEHGGIRPVLALQNDIDNLYSPTLIVAPATKQADKKPYLPTHVVLNKIFGMKYDEDSLFMLEWLRVIDKHYIRGYAGRLTKAQVEPVDKAVYASLGLSQDSV